MIDEHLKRYEPFFGKWHLGDRLGKGAFGEVYEIWLDDGPEGRVRSAMKFMPVPSEEALKNQIDVQPDMDAVRHFFAGQLERVKDEIRILQKCKGHSNIVSLEDYLIAENPGREGVGWDILIRMELLYPIVGSSGYFANPQATQLDVVRLWMNIANALIFCEQPGVDIIHRDIKPTNIMVSDAGIFKLSDFGAARKNLQGQDASTRIGTEQYMAPEVYKGKKYDKRADYYSLGVVIYFYLNGSRRPFMPPWHEQMDHSQMVLADEKRINGKSRIPEIPYVSAQVNRILLKSLAYRPQDRYQSAQELYRDLEKLASSQERDLAQRFLNDPRKGGHPSRSLIGWIAAAGILFTGSVIGLSGGIYLKKGVAEHSRTSDRPVPVQVETGFPEAAEETETMPVWRSLQKLTEEETIEPEMMAEPETMTESETMAEPETMTEPEMMIKPETGYQVRLESPREGSRADEALDVFGTILTGGTAGDLLLYGDITKGSRVLKSAQIRLGNRLSGRRPEEYVLKDSPEMTEASVYEIGDRIMVDDLEDGEYTFVLRRLDKDGTEEVLAEVSFVMDSRRIMSREQIREHEAEYLTKTNREAGYLWHSQLGYTIGMDQDGSRAVHADAGQIVLTGWINAPSSTVVGMLLEIDGNEHTFGDIAETMGGKAELIRTSRYLEGLPDEQRGGEAQNDDEGGWILDLSIPSLPEGEHEIRLIFHAVLHEQEYVDMSPLKVMIDHSVPPEEGRAERIAQEWRDQFPSPAEASSGAEGVFSDAG